MNLASIVNIYKQDGVAIIPQVFSQKEINQLRADMLQVLHTGTQNIEIIDGFPTILYDPPFITDRRVLEVVTEILGDSWERVTNQYYFHLPGDPDSFNWHTDQRFRPGIGDNYLQTGIIVDDWTDENGAVEYIKGSHKKEFSDETELRGFVRSNKKGERIYPKSGDLAIWSVLIVHGSEPNKSKYPRAYYMQGFQRENNSSDNELQVWPPGSPGD